MNLSDLNELDFSNVGGWPTAVKAVAIVLVFAIVCGAVYWFDTQHQIAELERHAKQEDRLKKDVQAKAKRAANLEKLKEQLAEMEKDFGKLRRQLPNDTEVAALLVDISQTGLSSGLEFEVFDPEPEIPKDFYAELPIQLRVTGNYHQFGEFVSGVALLPRIVTLHNINISVRDQNKLTMTAVAKTYRYMDDEGGK